MRGVKPFVGVKNDEVIAKIEMGERLALPPECPASLFRLMNLCWQYDPMDRPTFKDVESEIRWATGNLSLVRCNCLVSLLVT